MQEKALVLLAALCLGLAFGASAQEEAPQVLTSDLALRQEVESSTLTVNFVIVDEDTITKVTIDGEEQTIIPGDTVLITKEFVFTRGRQIIRVVAEDEEGNRRERSYLVAFGVPLEPPPEERKEEKLIIGFVFDVRLEVDDNPTQDLSLPFTVSEIGELEGVIDDSEQEDTRTTLKGLASVSQGKYSGYIGFVDTSYSDDDNEFLESQVIFLGGATKFGSDRQWILGAALSDIDLGGNDFATLITVSPGYETRDKEEDGTSKTLYGADVSSKMFEDGTRDDGIEWAIKRNYSFLETNKLDTYRGRLALGSRTEGTNESEFFFFRWDGDWANKWDSGFRWDIGLGYQYRDYPNDEDILTDELFGDTRVDNLFRVSTGVGLDFGKLSLMFNYNYTIDLSNDSPYVRQIYGLSLQGVF